MFITTYARSLLHTLEDWLENWLRGDEVGCPGVIVAYDPTTQKADVQPMIQRRSYDEDGTPRDSRLPVIPSVPVQFLGSSKFEGIWDLEYGDQVWLKFSRSSLDEWLSSGAEAGGRDLRRGSLADCVAEAGLRSFGQARTPCPAKTMRFGAVDGPQIVWDLNNLSLTLSAFNEVRVLGQTKVRIESDGDVFIQDRWVDPLGGDI